MRVRIVLRARGGLGNQLFRYAALRYYARRYNADMRISLDPEWNAFSYGYPRPCLLSHFSITVPMQERSLPDRLLLTEKPWLKAALAPLRKGLRVQAFTQQPADRYIFVPDVPLERSVRTLYLEGYWHTNIMVEKVADELRTELTFKEPAQGKNLAMLEQIRGSANSVSLHLRRGDAMIPSAGRVTLPKEYYVNAIRFLQQRMVNPTLFVFSDDIRFAKDIPPPGIRTVFIDHNDDFSAHEDMRLMSSCHHHIIANSTFSWWGAWLNSRPDKIVIAPKFWDLTPDTFYPDLIPQTWVLADVAA